MGGNINFGFLTFINGQSVNLSEWDKNGDGKLEQDELKALLAKYQLDSVEFSTIDRNGDKEVTDAELTFWAKEILLEDALNKLITTRISVEIIGENAQYQKSIIEELRDFTDEYIKSAEAEDIYKLTEQFVVDLDKKYEEIKENFSVVVVKPPERSSGTDETLNYAINGVIDYLRNNYSFDAHQQEQFDKLLNDEAARYLSLNSFANKFVLKSYLQYWLTNDSNGKKHLYEILGISPEEENTPNYFEI